MDPRQAEPRTIDPRVGGPQPEREDWGRRPGGGRRGGRGELRPEGRAGEDTRDSLRFRAATYNRPGGGSPEGGVPADRGAERGPTPERGQASEPLTGDQIHVVARDPYWLYAHWEITEATVERVVAELRNEWEGCKGILRVHSFPAALTSAGPTPGANASEGALQPAGFFDIEVDEDSTSWYIHAGVPERSYRVDVGVLTAAGAFYPIASSNTVTTPPDRVAAASEETWVDLPPAEASGQSGKAPSSETPRVTVARGGQAKVDPTSGADADRTNAGAPSPEVASPRAIPARGAKAVPPARPESPHTLGEWEEGSVAESYRARDEWSEDASEWRESAPVGSPRAASPEETIEPPSPPPVKAGRGAQGEHRRGHHAAVKAVDSALAPSVGRAPVPEATAWSPGASRPAVIGRSSLEPGDASRGAAASPFRFVLNTEIVIYGATEPDAQVEIDGKPVTLRSDGTFTVRIALPEGMHALPAIAASRDGSSTRRITTLVTRRTDIRAEDRPKDGSNQEE